MAERSGDWIAQARRDLENARWELKGEFFEWASFSAQQAAEKAIKAVYQRLGGLAFGHSTRELLIGLREKINPPEALLEKAAFLDRLYIPSRYPNGWPSGSPMDYINKEDAERAISYSRTILEFCQDILAR